MPNPIDIRGRALLDVDQLRVPPSYQDDLEGILLTRGEIDSRVERLAEQLDAEYADAEGGLYPVCVLKGAMRFYGDLLQQLSIPFREGVVSASRYGLGGAEPDGDATIEFLRPEAIAGRDVLFVEDIVDEGRTLAQLREVVEAYDPRSVSAISLLDKRDNRVADVELEHIGFVIPDEFVVGYGLDYEEEYRGLNHLGVLDEAVL